MIMGKGFVAYWQSGFMKMITRIRRSIIRNDKLAIGIKMACSSVLHGIKEAKRRKISYDIIQQQKPYDVLCTSRELKAQRNAVFKTPIEFTLIAFLNNAEYEALEQMILSIQKQTYEKWNLCLIAGNDAALNDLCREKAQKAEKDQRIHLLTSGNTDSIALANTYIMNSEGQYVAFVGTYDQLHPAALYEIMRAIETHNDCFIYTDAKVFDGSIDNVTDTLYKPDFSSDMLRSYNYISRFYTFSKERMKKAGGGLRPKYGSAMEYDLILRLTEESDNIIHLQMPLYFQSGKETTKADQATLKETQKRALEDHLSRIGLQASVEDGIADGTFHIRYSIKGKPRISIVIPNKDHVKELDTCLHSILEKSTWENYEIIIVENNSTERGTFDYYKQIRAKNARVNVVKWEGSFNYSSICNYGASFSTGEYLLMLNNDIEVITPSWMEEMLMLAQRDDVGMVGAKLYYPNDTVQHAGIAIGLGGVAGHVYRYSPRASKGYMKRLAVVNDLSAVTAACVLIPKNVWKIVDGFDESFAVGYNDVDLCLRVRAADYLIVWTPYAELYHYESISRGADESADKRKRYEGEVERFQKRWMNQLMAGDPYYNRNLTSIGESGLPQKDAV